MFYQFPNAKMKKMKRDFLATMFQGIWTYTNEKLLKLSIRMKGIQFAVVLF